MSRAYFCSVCIVEPRPVHTLTAVVQALTSACTVSWLQASSCKSLTQMTPPHAAQSLQLNCIAPARPSPALPLMRSNPHASMHVHRPDVRLHGAPARLRPGRRHLWLKGGLAVLLFVLCANFPNAFLLLLPVLPSLWVLRTLCEPRVLLGPLQQCTLDESAPLLTMQVSVGLVAVNLFVTVILVRSDGLDLLHCSHAAACCLVTCLVPYIWLPA